MSEMQETYGAKMPRTRRDQASQKEIFLFRMGRVFAMQAYPTLREVQSFPGGSDRVFCKIAVGFMRRVELWKGGTYGLSENHYRVGGLFR